MRPTFHTSLRLAATACVLAGALAATGPAAAQSPQMQELLNRLDRMQQEMTTLQRHVYRGEPPPPSAAAPQAATGGDSRTLVARLSVRIDQLEGEIRRLTGRNEELMHSVNQLQSRFDKLAADVDFRLGALERGGAAPGAMPGGAQAPAPAAPDAPGFQPSPRSESSAPAAPSARGEHVLGTLRTNPGSGRPQPLTPEAQTAPAPQSSQQAALPDETPQQQYDRAHALIVKDQNFAEAERVLRSFIEKNPDNELTPNAHYWLGRTYFVRRDFQQAAFTFAEGVQKFPRSEKAPANLLNLGMSLSRLGKEREACTAYARLLQSFPDVEESLKNRVRREQASAKCG